MLPVKNEQAASKLIQSFSAEQLKLYKKAHGLRGSVIDRDEVVDMMIEAFPELKDENRGTIETRLSDAYHLGAIAKHGHDEYDTASIEKFIQALKGEGSIVIMTLNFFIATHQKERLKLVQQA